jgi:fatty-acyl-CoA synthase
MNTSTERERSKTVPQLLDRAARNGANAGIIWNDRTVPYAEIASESRRLARGLLDIGLSSGDHVAIWMPNSPQFVSAFFACARIGVAVMMVNSRLSGVELADIVNRSNAKALFYSPDVPGASYRETFASVDPGTVAQLELVIEIDPRQATGETLQKRTLSFHDLIRAAPLQRDLCTAESAALLYSTSGSTGPSKLVLHTHASVANHAQDIAGWLGLEGNDTVSLIAIPLAGAYGFTQAMAAIASGHPLVLMEKFEAASTFEALRKHRVTNFGAFDEVIIKLLEISNETPPFPSLKTCLFGIFTPGYADFESECEQRGIRLIGLYGSSELQACCIAQKLDAPFADRIRAGGFPVSHHGKVRVRHLETGDLCPAGVSGEIEIFAPSRMAGYFGNDKATKERITPDGFYRTGDTGTPLADGSVAFEGRMEEILRLSGYMVPTAEIETVIRNSTGVDDCKVVGILTEAGARPVCFFVKEPDGSVDLDALRAECAARLARFKQPIAFYAVNEFPLVNSLNAPKVDKQRLKRVAQDIHDRKLSVPAELSFDAA